jgi:long-chain acyl-CoA synthetase
MNKGQMQQSPLQMPQSIDQFLRIACDNFGAKPMWSVLEGSASGFAWSELTGDQAWTRIENLKKRLLLAGVTSESRVAIVAETSLDWMCYFFAALRCGATVCPFDVKLTASEIHGLLDQFKATHIFCSSTYSGELEKNVRVIQLVSRLVVFGHFEDISMITINHISKDSPTAHPETAHLIIYTSGTQGAPKGVTIPLTCVYFEVASISSGTVTPDYYRTAFSIMPLNHIYGVSAGLFYYMWTGLEFCQTQSLAPEHISRVLREKNIHQMMTVPLLLKMLRTGIIAKVNQKPALTKIIFRTAIWINSKLKSRWIAQTFFSEVRSAVAPGLERIVCGGAPLDTKYEDFFQALGWPVFAGYGLTETGPVISVNTEQAARRGSVGVPLREVEVKIVTEGGESKVGEILTRGRHVFTNYENAPELTREVLNAEGWFHTGDLGYVDDSGFLFIVGRIKSMIVLPSGKKIQPEEIEAIIRLSPLVKDVCVIGLVDKQIGVKVIAQILLEDATVSVTDPAQTKPLTDQLQALCKTIAAFKRPQEFWYRAEPFPMTSSQKIKRHQLQKDLQRELERDRAR